MLVVSERQACTCSPLSISSLKTQRRNRSGFWLPIGAKRPAGASKLIVDLAQEGVTSSLRTRAEDLLWGTTERKTRWKDVEERALDRARRTGARGTSDISSWIVAGVRWSARCRCDRPYRKRFGERADTIR